MNFKSKPPDTLFGIILLIWVSLFQTNQIKNKHFMYDVIMAS